MNELTNLKIEEVSLVDNGANPEADIVLAKRDDPAQSLIERLTKRLQDMETQLEEQELKKVAAKYELIENSEELIPALKVAKSAGNYEQIIKLLDKTLSLVEKSQVFEEIGKSGSREASVEEMAKSIQKNNPSMTWRQCLDVAYRKAGVLE